MKWEFLAGGIFCLLICLGTWVGGQRYPVWYSYNGAKELPREQAIEIANKFPSGVELTDQQGSDNIIILYHFESKKSTEFGLVGRPDRGISEVCIIPGIISGILFMASAFVFMEDWSRKHPSGVNK